MLAITFDQPEQSWLSGMRVPGLSKLKRNRMPGCAARHTCKVARVAGVTRRPGTRDVPELRQPNAIIGFVDVLLQTMQARTYC